MTVAPDVSRIEAALSTLKDVAGISGSFVFTHGGHLVGREMHAMFDDATLGDAAERLARLRDTFAAVGDTLDIAVIRFADHKLYLKVLPGAILCILADGVVNMAALRMAASLVGRRIAAELEREDAAPTEMAATGSGVATASGPVPAYPAAAQDAAPSTPPVPAPRPPVFAPGTRRFRGRSV